MDQRLDDALVPLIEAIAIDLQHRERGVGHVLVDLALRFDLGVIAHPPEQIVRSARRTPRASRDFGGARRVDLDSQQTRAAHDDLLHFLGRVIIEPRGHPESRTQRRAYHSRASGRADECKLWQLQSQTARLRALVDDDVEPIIFHRRIQIFFDRRLEPMDLVDEKDVAFFQTGEQTGEFARFFNHRAAGVFHVHTHGVGDDVSEGGFAEARRPAQQNVFEHVAAFLGRFDHQLETLAHFQLAGELAEHRRPQRNLESGVWFRRFHFGCIHFYSRFLVSTSSVPRGFKM